MGRGRTERIENGRRERIENGSRERIEIERKGTKGKLDKEHRHLPLFVVQLPQGTEFPTRFLQ